MKIHITEATKQALDCLEDIYQTELRGTMEIKVENQIIISKHINIIGIIKSR